MMTINTSSRKHFASIMSLHALPSHNLRRVVKGCSSTAILSCTCLRASKTGQCPKERRPSLVHLRYRGRKKRSSGLVSRTSKEMSTTSIASPGNHNPRNLTALRSIHVACNCPRNRPMVEFAVLYRLLQHLRYLALQAFRSSS